MKSEYIDNIYSTSIKTDIKGFIDAEKIQELKNGATVVTLPLGMEYRPDKISAYYYGTPEYDWVILLVNTINGLQDLTLGKELVIPSIETIKFLGLK